MKRKSQRRTQSLGALISDSPAGQTEMIFMHRPSIASDPRHLGLPAGRGAPNRGEN